MSTIPARKPAAISKIYIKIGDFSGGDFSGTAQLLCGTETLRFVDIADMILGCDRIFDAVSVLPSEFGSRLSTPRALPDGRDPGEVYAQAFRIAESGGAMPEADFNVDLQSRRNADWQGRLLWPAQGKSQRFGSSVELTKLILSAFGGVSSSGGVW